MWHTNSGCRLLVRPATLADASEVANIHVESWVSAYKGILPEDFLNTVSFSNRVRFWVQTIEDEPGRVLVCTDGHFIQGWVHFGMCRDEGVPIGWGEMYALYIRPSHWRLGYGYALWSEASARLKALGSDVISVWTLEQNTQAALFYTRQGLKVDGASKEIIRGGKSLREIRYSKSLSE